LRQDLGANASVDAGATLAGDLLHGCAAIGAFLGIGPRRAFFLAKKAALPGVQKLSGRWVGSKSVLRNHFQA
jgi:hypothetical protein